MPQKFTYTIYIYHKDIYSDVKAQSVIHLLSQYYTHFWVYFIPCQFYFMQKTINAENAKRVHSRTTISRTRYCGARVYIQWKNKMYWNGRRSYNYILQVNPLHSCLLNNINKMLKQGIHEQYEVRLWSGSVKLQVGSILYCSWLSWL